MTTDDGANDAMETQATGETPQTPQGGDSGEAMTTPRAPPPDPRKEALRKYAGLLLQHKVRARATERPKDGSWTRSVVRGVVFERVTDGLLS